MSTLDQQIRVMYDDVLAIQRKLVDARRELQELAQRDDIAVDTLGAETTPGEAIAIALDELAAFVLALDDAEQHRTAAQRAASRA